MSSVVVLTKGGQYWDEVGMRKVLKWVASDKLKPHKDRKIKILITDEEREIGCDSFKIKRPLVVMLIQFVGFRSKNEEIPYSHGAIYERDDNICQYWHKDENGKKFKYRCTDEERTIDHVIPSSRGGKNSFENNVCSCRHCNEIIKKNRSPEEAGLELIRKPFVPTRRKNEMIVFMKFSYRRGNPAHQAYYENVLNQAFSNVV